MLTFLKGEVPDRVPWFGDLTYWAGARENDGDLPEGFGSSDEYYDFHRDLGVGFYLQGYQPSIGSLDDTITAEGDRTGVRIEHTVNTPVGSLTQIQQALPDSATVACLKHYVDGPEDLAALRWWFEHTEFSANYSEAVKRQGLVEDLGVVLCYLPKSPFMQMMVVYAGVETVIDLWMDVRDEFEATLAVMEAKVAEDAQICVDSPAECLMIPENLSSEVVGKNFYESYVRSYHERWTDAIRSAGKTSFIHVDGTVEGLGAEVAQSGFDVIEAVTPKPVGDISLQQMRDLVGEKTILWGGLPGIYFTPHVSDEEFESYTRQTLELMRQTPNYVLGVADQVPPDGTRERIARVVELAKESGRY